MVFHHIEDTGRVLRNCRALLAPGGPTCVADLDYEDGSFHEDMTGVEHSGFEREKLASLARECGFTEVGLSTSYVIRKEVGGVERDYPIFLMVAK